MKKLKLIFIATIALFVATSITSCQKSSSSYADLIVGYWEYTKGVIEYSNGKTETEEYSSGSGDGMLFTSGGKVTIYSDGEPESTSDYSIEGNALIINSIACPIVTLTSSQLVVKMTSSSGTATVYLTKSTL